MAPPPTSTPPATPRRATPARRPRSQAPAPAPEKSKPAPKSNGSGNYTVKAGDTLAKIAKAHGTTWKALYSDNKSVIGGNPNLIIPGQKLDV